MAISRRGYTQALICLLFISVAALFLQISWYSAVDDKNHKIKALSTGSYYSTTHTLPSLTTRSSTRSATTNARLSTTNTPFITTTKKSTTPPAPVRCGDIPRRYPDTIPPIVHWTSRDGRIPGKLVPLVKSWRQLLDSSTTKWHFMHWDDHHLSQMISAHYPRVAKSYAKLINGLERSDIGRLVVLHHIGGVYVDTDVELRKDLTPLLMLPHGLKTPPKGNLTRMHNGLPGWSAILVQEPLEHAAFLFDMDRLITNAIMLSKANHSFLSYVLQTWPTWFESNWATKKRVFDQAVHITGPIMLHNLYEKYLTLAQSERPNDWHGLLLADPDVFQPIWDPAWAPIVVKSGCTNPRRKPLNEMKRRICDRLARTNFASWPIPASSFTVHRYMHLSYTDRMDFRGGSHIADLLPVFTCTL